MDDSDDHHVFDPPFLVEDPTTLPKGTRFGRPCVPVGSGADGATERTPRCVDLSLVDGLAQRWVQRLQRDEERGDEVTR